MNRHAYQKAITTPRHDRPQRAGRASRIAGRALTWAKRNPVLALVGLGIVLLFAFLTWGLP